MSTEFALSTRRPAVRLAGRHRLPLALALMVASGFAGLGYQIVWTQQSALWLGHEAAAVLAVVTAFFGGLAIGASALAPRIERSARPHLWYAACEAVIGGWSLVLGALLGPLADALLVLTGETSSPPWQWGVAFAGTLLMLLPATAAMGATLPAMQRIVGAVVPQGRSIGALYAGNTVGAVVGVLAATLWLVPHIGLARTAWVCAALNAFCAVAALSLGGTTAQLAAPGPAARDRRILAMFLATGLLGIGYEVLVVRVLSQVAEDTVYTFALLLAVYLVGTALGAAAWQRWLARADDPARVRDRLLALQSVACLAGIATLWGAQSLHDAVARVLGGGMPAALGAEAALALAAFGLPTLVMGALFSHLAAQALAARTSFGIALAVNTLGAALAPLVIGVLLAPAAGPKAALLLVAAGYLALAAHRRAAWPVGVLIGAPLLAMAVLAPPLAFVDVPPDGRVVSYRDGTMAAVSVVADADGVARLRINNRQQEGSSATGLADGRQAWLPLLLHPAPRQALFLGLGTGLTANAATEDPALQVDAAELLPEVIDASAQFRGEAAEATAASRLHVIAADARRFVRTTHARYDVIVADNFHPARSGSGALYTVEHFRAVRSRLSADGVFCQWLPLHQLDLDTLRSIVRSFVAVFPDAGALLATNSLQTPVIGLVARADAARFSFDAVRDRLADAPRTQGAARRGLVDPWAVLGSFVAGPQALTRFAGDAPPNTDDHPVVAYRAPRLTYAPDSAPQDRLVALLESLDVAPAELVAADGATTQRLAAYRRARDRFLAVGRDVTPSADVRHMLAQVREPLVAALRTSADFRPAYDPLLRMAAALARIDTAAAREVLDELQRLQPARPEAAALLAQLAGTTR